MGSISNAEKLIVPVYINEKIVLDMLAIIEDGFSTISQINYSEHKASNTSQKAEAGISSVLLNLLRIKVTGELKHTGSSEEKKDTATERIHTNVSLFSKFRSFLMANEILKTDIEISNMNVGDFIEFEGKLQKNPLIDYMDKCIELLKMSNVFLEPPQYNKKNQGNKPKKQNSKTLHQIESFASELKHSGTIDFVLSDKNRTAVLSAQEQYLANDNISEIIGGRFKVLGKVISICQEDKDEIDLLRKTSLSILPDKLVSEMLSQLKNDEMKQLDLPELITKIQAPAVIIIPIAIFA